jgi:hypothetical protein
VQRYGAAWEQKVEPLHIPKVVSVRSTGPHAGSVGTLGTRLRMRQQQKQRFERTRPGGWRDDFAAHRARSIRSLLQARVGERRGGDACGGKVLH